MHGSLFEQKLCLHQASLMGPLFRLLALVVLPLAKVSDGSRPFLERGCGLVLIFKRVRVRRFGVCPLRREKHECRVCFCLVHRA